MMGIIEIFLIILVFCAMWFFIFYIKLILDNKKILKDIVKKMEKQNKRFFQDGKEFDLKKELNLTNSPVEVQKKQIPKKPVQKKPYKKLVNKKPKKK